MTTRRKLLVALGGVLAAPLASFAQQKPAKVARIGVLGQVSASAYASEVEALRAGLRDLGYVEGKNIVIEYRWAEGKPARLPELAAELVGLKVDVLVTHGAPGSLAAKRATTSVPIVMYAGDAIAYGIVASLARPGGNVTGSSTFNPEISAKRLELIKEAFPRTNRVAVLMKSSTPANGPLFQAMETTARSLKLELQKFEVRAPDEFDSAFLAMAKGRVDALALPLDSLFVANAKTIADLAAKQRLPSFGFTEFAEAGGLMANGVSLLEMWRRHAYFVDKILKGAKPADLPVEQPTKFELVINMKTAKALGIKFPQSILVRADRVIE